MFVVDSENHRIAELDKNMQFIGTLAQMEMKMVSSVVLIELQLMQMIILFFGDWENHLIQKFNKYGYWLLKIRQRGSGDAEFHRRWDFAVCKASGKIFVSDTDENHRIQVFSSVSKFLFTFGSK